MHGSCYAYTSGLVQRPLGAPLSTSEGRFKGHTQQHRVPQNGRSDSGAPFLGSPGSFCIWDQRAEEGHPAWILASLQESGYAGGVGKWDSSGEGGGGGGGEGIT